MPLVVVGSVAIDNIETPTARRDNCLGGSATHFSYAASFFTGVRLVGVVGEDWPTEHTELLSSRGIDVAGLTQVQGGKTFTWTGRYEPNMNDRETLEVELNVFGEFDPVLPDDYRKAKYVFLANGVPERSGQKVLEQTPGRRLAVADTMDLWIVEHQSRRSGRIDAPTRWPGAQRQRGQAAHRHGKPRGKAGHMPCVKWDPKLRHHQEGRARRNVLQRARNLRACPRSPPPDVVDPTGAGDSFAGGMMGYLAEQDDFEPATLKRAMAYGTITASFNVEGFGLERMKQVTRDDIDRRMADYEKMLSF